MKVVSVKSVGRSPVYNMTVDETHDFVINGGVISHNCDDVRYFCMMNPIAPRIIEKAYEPISDPLNQFSNVNSHSKYRMITQ